MFSLFQILDKTVWVLSTGRNAVVVIICLFVAKAFDPVIDGKEPRETTFILTGNIEAGLPGFKVPDFDVW